MKRKLPITAVSTVTAIVASNSVIGEPPGEEIEPLASAIIEANHAARPKNTHKNVIQRRAAGSWLVSQ